MPKLENVLLAGLLLFLGAALSLSAQMMQGPSVSVEDQKIRMNRVVVPEVVSDGPGWIVIHADNNGAPGPVIGHKKVTDGVNKNVRVKIDTAKATDTLYAMLHTDSGVIGTYEFPGGDPPVKVNGKIVVKPFKVTS
jgi:hypothetical protein